MSVYVKKRHRGMHFNRTKREPLERALAVAWQQQQEAHETSTINYLLAKDNHPRDGEVSDRDRLVAATVIQWLGSNVGQRFLAEAKNKVRS